MICISILVVDPCILQQSLGMIDLELVVLLVLLVLGMVESKPVNGNTQDRPWKLKKSECEEFDCGHLEKEEAYNCVNNCTSTVCFDKIYAESPLEDGEIDLERRRLFITCLRNEVKLNRVSGF